MTYRGREKALLRQEIDGPQAEQLMSLPRGSRALLRLEIKDHIFLILKGILPTTRVQKGSLKVKKGGGTCLSLLESILAERCVHTHERILR